MPRHALDDAPTDRRMVDVVRARGGRPSSAPMWRTVTTSRGRCAQWAGTRAVTAHQRRNLSGAGPSAPPRHLCRVCTRVTAPSRIACCSAASGIENERAERPLAEIWVRWTRGGNAAVAEPARRRYRRTIVPRDVQAGPLTSAEDDAPAQFVSPVCVSPSANVALITLTRLRSSTELVFL